MRRLLLAGALAVAGLAAAPASACTVDTCWFTQPVCSLATCHICYYEPPGAQRCLT